MLDVRLFALFPRRLWHFIRITAAQDYLGNLVAEQVADLVQCTLTTLVFHGVVKQSSDHFVFTAARFANQ